MCDGFPDQEYQSAAVQRGDRQKIQNSQVNSKHQGDVQHIHQYILPAVILGTFVGLANNIYRDAYRACHILPGDLPLHQHRQTLPGHVHAVAHLIPGIPEAVQSGQFYEIRITDADQIAAFALIVLRCQRCSSLYTIPFIFHRYFSATVSQSK